MIPDSLSTNQVKKSDAAEVEFARKANGDNTALFAQVNESPALEHRLKVAHQEIGSNTSRRRRSTVRMAKKVVSDIDPTKVVEVVVYIVCDLPVGALTSMDEPKNVLAEILSFCASTGADTTVKYDCTGTGAAALINGTL